MIRRGEEPRRRNSNIWPTAPNSTPIISRARVSVAVRRVYRPRRHSISRCHHVDATLRFSRGSAIRTSHVSDHRATPPRGYGDADQRPSIFGHVMARSWLCKTNMTKGERRRRRVSWTAARLRELPMCDSRNSCHMPRSKIC